MQSGEQPVHFDRVREHSRAHADTAEPCVGCDNFGVSYGNFLALAEVTLQIPAGQITAFMGPSGCGKSTLLRSINRMNDTIPSARFHGALDLHGDPIYAPGVNLIRLRKRVGMVFQKANPFPASVFENVAWGPRMHRLYRGDDLHNHVEDCLRRAGLWDEVKDKLKLMSTLVPQLTIIIVTHNIQQAARVSDCTGFFWVDDNRTGRLAEFGSTGQLFQSPADERTERYLSGRVG